MTDTPSPAPPDPIKKPLTFDHLMSRKKARTETVDIVLDDELARAVTQAQMERDQAFVFAVSNEENKAAAERLTRAEEALEEAKRVAREAEAVATFRFVAIGGNDYEELLEEHPPTEEQVAKAKEDGEEAVFNSDTFFVALVAASCVEPEMTEEQVDQLTRDPRFNNAEVAALFQTALLVNSQRRRVNLGEGSGGTQRSAKKSRTASKKASRGRSS